MIIQQNTSQELASVVRYAVAEQDRILRKKEVARIFSIARSTLDDWLRPDSPRYKPDFPQRIQVGTNSIGFLESEIRAYLTKLSQVRK